MGLLQRYRVGWLQETRSGSDKELSGQVPLPALHSGLGRLSAGWGGRTALLCAPHPHPGLPLSPGASLISSAVRMRAISVDVKWTVMSSLEMGMFIRTRRWG